MARNEEKHYSRLNRLILQQEKEGNRKRNPKRPKLDSLNSVEDIKEWLPSIKKDLDFSLKQSEVTCYSEQKIAEIQNNILQLEREFKSFVRKSKQLKPEMDHIPWTNRPYKSNKLDTEENGNFHCDKGTFVHIKTPILEENSLETEECKISYTNVNLDQLDLPLKFKTTETKNITDRISNKEEENLISKNLNNQVEPQQQSDNYDSSLEKKDKLLGLDDSSLEKKGNLLGLDYSSSDSET